MKNRHAWAARVNTQGLYSNEPVRITYERTSGFWKDEGAHIVVKKLGLEFDSSNDIIFTHTDITQVRAWMYGVASALHLVGGWANSMTYTANLLFPDK